MLEVDFFLIILRHILFLINLFCSIFIIKLYRILNVKVFTPFWSKSFTIIYL